MAIFFLKPSSLLSVFLTLALLVIPLAAGAKLKVGDQLSGVLKSQDIDFDLDLFNLNEGDNFGLSSEIGIRVFPNNDLKTFSRVEPLRFEWTLGLPVPLGVVAVTGQKTDALVGEFVRQFGSQIDAFNVFEYPPYIIEKNIISAHKIPFTLEKAMALAHKDYFRYQVRTAFTVNGGVGYDMGLVNLVAGKTYVVYGDIQIEVYKKENQKILVRASSLKQNQKQNVIGLRKNFLLEVFEVTFFDKIANELIPTELIQFDLQSNTEGSLFGIEYEFDLNSEAGRKAYDHMMNYKNWNYLELVKVINGGKQQALSALEMRITEAEIRSQLGLGDVKKIVRSSTHFSESSKGSFFNFRLVRASDKSQFIEQNVSLMSNPMTDDRKNYRIATVILNEDIGGWLLFNAGQNERDEANIIFALDSDYKIEKLLEMCFSYERLDESFNKRNQSDTAGHIYKLLPGDLHGPGVRDFVSSLSKFHKDEVFVDVDLSLEPRALVVINRLSDAEIQETADTFIEAFFKDQAVTNELKRDFGQQRLVVKSNTGSPACNSTPQNQMDQDQRFICFRSAYGKDIEKIVSLLPEIIRISGGKNYELQAAKMIELQKLELFKKAGSGIISRLLMRGVLKKSNDINEFYKFAKVRLHIRGNDVAPITYELGRDDEFENINELFKIRGRILNRNYDPLFFAN